MKHFLWSVCFLLVALCVAAPASFAAGKVAVLDLQRIMKESKAAKSIRDQLESKRDQYQKEITKDEEKLRKRDKRAGG
jgi:Skp family chaperone for outer membrane proteins